MWINPLSVFTRINTSQHKCNTNQHEQTRVQHESTRIRHESTRINTSPTRVNTNQHESDTSQHKSTRVRQELIRPRNYHSLSQFQLVKYDSSLNGLIISFIYYLEITNKLEKYLDAIQVFVNSFSLVGVNQFIYQE